MRAALACLAPAIFVARAHAAPLAHLDADADDGDPFKLELEATGALRITSKAGTATIDLAPGVTRATLAIVRVKGVPTIVVDATTTTGDEAFVLERRGSAWKQLARVPVGGVGLDHEYGWEVEARPEGIYRYQTRAGYHRCDGKPAYLFAEGWNGSKFQRLARIPTEVPDTAPILAVRTDGAPAAAPVIYQARVASYQAGVVDAGGLAIPVELDDGKLGTGWHEELVTSAGEGQFFTFEPRVAGARAAQLRIVPGNPTSASTMKAVDRPRRIAIVAAQGAWRIDLPDAAADPLGTAYVADLPAPVDGCVTVILETTYGPANGTTAIAELEVFADGERGGGGAAALARVVAEGADGGKVAAQGLARLGATGAAAVDGELARTSDGATRGRLVRALLELRDPAAGPILARAATLGWVRGGDLVDAIAALGRLAQPQALHELAGRSDLVLDARIAAVRALGVAGGAKDLVELAGQGPRELRHAVIEALTGIAVATLVPVAPTESSSAAAGDLWRAITRRARARPAERDAALHAMVEALPAATDYERRYRLIDGIASIGDAPALQALQVLLRGLPATAQRAAFEQIAARGIAVDPRPEALELVVGFARDADPGVRLAALSTIAGAEGGTAGPWHAADGPDAIDRVVQTALASDTWPEVRRRAAQVLGGRCSRIGPARALGDAVGRDPDLDVRGDALAALVECKATGAAELLARIWDDTKLPLELRQRAVELAVALGDPALAGKLVGRFASWRGAAISSAAALTLAQNAAYALGRLAPPGAAAALQDALDEAAFPEIVAAAATGLGLMGPGCPSGARTKLRALAHADDPTIQPAALHAAAQCGKPLP